MREILQKRYCEDLLSLCCSIEPVRYMRFTNSMNGFSSNTLEVRLKELEREEHLLRQGNHGITPRVEYGLIYNWR